jgi:uncharacterized membrane protein
LNGIFEQWAKLLPVMGQGVPSKSLLGHEPPSLRAPFAWFDCTTANRSLLLSYALFLVRARFLQRILHVFVTEVVAGFRTSYLFSSGSH